MMFPDLTTVNVPFGLLDEATQEALKAHGGPYEVWVGGEWDGHPHPAWSGSYVYRVKPTPPEPREFWMEKTPTGLIAVVHVSRAPETMDGRNELIHVREVLE